MLKIVSIFIETNPIPYEKRITKVCRPLFAEPRPFGGCTSSGHCFPGSASPEIYRQHVGWTGPLGNAESRIVEIAYSQGSAPEAVLQAFIKNKNSLGLPFSGYVLVYDSAYRFERGYSYTEGKLQKSQQLKLKREPLAMAQDYPIGAHTCQQQLLVTSGPEAANTYPLPDLCYQAVWNIQFALKGSYLDINPYLD